MPVCSMFQSPEARLTWARSRGRPARSRQSLSRDGRQNGAVCRKFYGSDGTPTRELPRDRSARRNRARSSHGNLGCRRMVRTGERQFRLISPFSAPSICQRLPPVHSGP
jgi:hypothetical protein